MTNKYCDSPIHKCLCLSLALIFIFTIVLSVPASADDVTPSPSPSPIRPNEPIGWKDGDTFRDIMLVVLDSWGISFSDPSGDHILLDLFDSLFEEFLDVTNQYAYEFWDDVKYGANEFGNLILDFTGVNAIRSFANWLVDRYSLSDNNSVSVNLPSISSPEGLAGFVYDAGTNLAFGIGTNYPVYKVNDGWALCFIGINSGGDTFGGNWDIVISVTDSSTSDGLINGQGRYFTSSFEFANKTWYVCTCDGNPSWGGRITSNPADLPVFNDVQFFTPNAGLNYQAIASVIQIYWQGAPSGSVIDIVTRDIDIPSGNDITPDDGIEIQIPGTNWGDSIYTILNIIERLIGLYDSTQLNINTVIDLITTLLQGLQKSVSIENIPGAVILDYDEYDIPLETEWSLVDGFFSEETEGSPFSALTSVIYGFPEPFVLFFSVIVVFVVAYGFIRMGRDSH